MRYYYYRITGGVLLISTGVFIWLSNLGVIHIAWRRDWPVIIVAIGLIELIKHLVPKKSS